MEGGGGAGAAGAGGGGGAYLHQPPICVECKLATTF